jgi:hypothetical protein
MIMDELDDEDGPRILAFYERIGREPTGYDRMEEKAALAFVEEIQGYLKRGSPSTGLGTGGETGKR